MLSNNNHPVRKTSISCSCNFHSVCFSILCLRSNLPATHIPEAVFFKSQLHTTLMANGFPHFLFGHSSLQTIQSVCARKNTCTATYHLQPVIYFYGRAEVFVGCLGCIQQNFCITHHYPGTIQFAGSTVTHFESEITR